MSYELINLCEHTTLKFRDRLWDEHGLVICLLTSQELILNG